MATTAQSVILLMHIWKDLTPEVFLRSGLSLPPPLPGSLLISLPDLTPSSETVSPDLSCFPKSATEKGCFQILLAEGSSYIE